MCKSCVKTAESLVVIKIKENPGYDTDTAKKEVEDKSEGKDEDESNNEEDKENDDDIPLIDSQPDDKDDVDDKPGVLARPYNIHFTNSGSDSPDIFHLRAPLVSCENILTPAISTDFLLD